ncbi:hypothetical protein D3C71_1384020 [compost metagenome]
MAGPSESAAGVRDRPFTRNWIACPYVTLALGANSWLDTPLITPASYRDWILASAGSPFRSLKAKADAPTDREAAIIPQANVILAPRFKLFVFIISSPLPYRWQNRPKGCICIKVCPS